MRIDETGHKRCPAEIAHGRPRASLAQYVCRRADREDPAIADGYCLGVWQGFIHRHDVCIRQHRDAGAGFTDRLRRAG